MNTFNQDGFALVQSAVSHFELDLLIVALEAIKPEKSKEQSAAGIRHLLKRSEAVREFAKSNAVLGIARKALGKDAKAVKAILFDKSPSLNWYVTWHQDLTIAVKEKVDVPGFETWSVKDGVPHVQPPATILEGMVALRVHLDQCLSENGAIKFLPGTHVSGILEHVQIAALREERKSICCEGPNGAM